MSLAPIIITIKKKIMSATIRYPGKDEKKLKFLLMEM